VEEDDDAEQQYAGQETAETHGSSLFHGKLREATLVTSEASSG
jgi:hypothetical protein